jgi:predicted alpha/beta-hydrolase family hydrolase
VEGYALSPAVGFHWLADGDHDFAPHGNSGVTAERNLASAAAAAVAFIRALPARRASAL